MIDKSKFSSLIDKMKEEGKYRIFNDVLRERGRYPRSIWYGPDSIKKIINWCSNDYLGMGQNNQVLDAMNKALYQTGSGSGGTRNIGGTSYYHVELENELADLHKKERALLFTSAYVANEWTIISLSKIIPKIEFISDSKNHNSLIVGINHSGSPKKIFKHNDMDDLEDLVMISKQQGRVPCIVFESVYSMDGDVSPIEKICDIADRYGAITYIDEVHAVGIYGKEGAGKLEELNLQHRVDIVNGTLGKSFGTQGGYIAGDNVVLDAIRSVAAGFIFTTSLSPIICAGALAAIKFLRKNNDLRENFHKRIEQIKQSLIDAQLPIMPCSTTHMLPLLVGEAKKCKKISDILLNEHGIYLQPIQYPTVEVGTERLRIVPTPNHTDQMVDELIKALKEVLYNTDLDCSSDSIYGSD